MPTEPQACKIVAPAGTFTFLLLMDNSTTGRCSSGLFGECNIRCCGALKKGRFWGSYCTTLSPLQGCMVYILHSSAKPLQALTAEWWTLEGCSAHKQLKVSDNFIIFFSFLLLCEWCYQKAMNSEFFFCLKQERSSCATQLHLGFSSFPIPPLLIH